MTLDIQSIIAFIFGAGGIFIVFRAKILKMQRDEARTQAKTSENKQEVSKKIIENLDDINKKEQEARKDIFSAKNFADLFNIYNNIVRKNSDKSNKN